MRLPKSLALVMAVALGLTACASPRLFPPPIPSAAPDWTIRLTQSGGFAGVQLLVEVNSVGLLKAEDQRSQRRATQTISNENLSQLDELIRNAPAPVERLQSRCADCFIYELEITAAGPRTRVVADDTTLAASGAEELIRFLQRLRDAALSSSA